MPLKPGAINKFLLLKLPSAYFCGVRVSAVSSRSCTTTVKFRWINQNPFKSMFWAVQGMAAELSTGALVMSYIKEYNKPISMLLVANKATYSKKATGRITFECEDGEAVRNAIIKTTETGERVSCWMHSVGRDEMGDVVSEFDFEWSVRLKMK